MPSESRCQWERGRGREGKGRPTEKPRVERFKAVRTDCILSGVCNSDSVKRQVRVVRGQSSVRVRRCIASLLLLPVCVPFPVPRRDETREQHVPQGQHPQAYRSGHRALPALSLPLPLSLTCDTSAPLRLQLTLAYAHRARSVSLPPSASVSRNPLRSSPQSTAASTRQVGTPLSCTLTLYTDDSKSTRTRAGHSDPR